MAKRRPPEGGTKGDEGKKAGTDKKWVCKDGERQYSQGKQSSSSFPCADQPSFFKVMIGYFEEVLFIPPKFADKLVGLVNQNVFLEDFCGKLSKVKVSRVDASLAFQEGWPDFVVDHSISVGEVVVFKYVSRTLFLVQIFGISACERISFSGSRIGNIVDAMETTRSPCNIINRQVTEELKKMENSLVEQHKAALANDTSLHYQNTVNFELHSDHVAQFCIEENLARHENSELECHIASTVPCATSEIKNQTVCYWDIIPYKPKLDFLLPLSTTEKGLAGEQEKHNIQMLNIPPEEVVCKFVITEEGVCHHINHDFMEKFTASIMTPTGLASSEFATCISCNNIVPVAQDAPSPLASVPEGTCPSSIVDNVEDEPGNGMHANEENGHISGFSSLVGGVGSIIHGLPAVETIEGTLPDPLKEVDEKDGTACASQNVNVENFEAIDLHDPSPQNSFRFSIILSSDPICWLELPVSLPNRKGRKRRKSKIVILQDPSHRLWPVMYLESFKFVGFSSGWENFAVANNLHQGNQCEFFYAAGNDSVEKFAQNTDVFQVQIIPV